MGSLRNLARTFAGLAVLVTTVLGATLISPRPAWAAMSSSSTAIDVDNISVDKGVSSDYMNPVDPTHLEADFGRYGSGAVPRCTTRDYGGGSTSTTCAEGNGDWVPDGNATVHYWHDGNHIMAHVLGSLGLHGRVSYQDCGNWLVRVTFRYADGTADTKAPDCPSPFPTRLDVNVMSSGLRDVVRVEISGPVTGSSDTCRNGALGCRGSYASTYVGDAPDSEGSASRLDRDPLNLSLSGQPFFTSAQAIWALAAPQSVDGSSFRRVTAHVTGTVTGSSSCGGSSPGSRSRLTLRFAFNSQDSDYVWRTVGLRPGESAQVDVTNPVPPGSTRAVPPSAFEVHVTAEGSVDSGASWYQCGSEIWKKLGDA